MKRKYDCTVRMSSYTVYVLVGVSFRSPRDYRCRRTDQHYPATRQRLTTAT